MRWASARSWPRRRPRRARRAVARPPRASAPNQRRESRSSVAVKLRLMRMGKTKQPTYRLVAADARSPRDGRFIEIVGTYQPRHDPSTIDIDNDKCVKWLQQGAQPTERVEKLLKLSGAWDQFQSAKASAKSSS